MFNRPRMMADERDPSKKFRELDFLSKATRPAQEDDGPGFLSKLGSMFSGGDENKLILQSLMDVQKRAAMQPVLETEALFKAFGKDSGLSEAVEKGPLGADPLSDIVEFEKTRDRSKLKDEYLRARIDQIRGGYAPSSAQVQSFDSLALRGSKTKPVNELDTAENSDQYFAQQAGKRKGRK